MNKRTIRHHENIEPNEISLLHDEQQDAPEMMEQIIEDRLDRFDPKNNTPERLAVRHEVTKSRLSQYSRDVV